MYATGSVADLGSNRSAGRGFSAGSCVRGRSMQNRLFVGNLPFSASDDAIRELFSAHGEVAKVTVVTDRETGRPRGFAFVEMTSDADAARAVRECDGTDFGGRGLRVNIAEPRESRGGGGGGGGGGNRGSQGRRDRY
jgi:RNA recognition motif-containing protein